MRKPQGGGKCYTWQWKLVGTESHVGSAGQQRKKHVRLGRRETGPVNNNISSNNNHAGKVFIHCKQQVKLQVSRERQKEVL